MKAIITNISDNKRKVELTDTGNLTDNQWQVINDMLCREGYVETYPIGCGRYFSETQSATTKLSLEKLGFDVAIDYDL